MFECEHGVSKNHARARPLHYVLYFLPHIGFIAVHLAEGAKLFIYLERTFFEAEQRIFGELFTLFAYILTLCPVIAAAVIPYHNGY